MSAVMDAVPQANGSVTSAAKRSRRASAASTPRSMTPPQADAAVSSPKEIDFGAVVKEIMRIETKNAVGTVRLVSNKSKQHIFALACKAVRSLRGLEPVEVVENGVKIMRPARISDADEKSVKDAISDLWLAELRGFLTFGGDITQCDLRITKNQPVTSVIQPKDSTVKDKDGNALHDLNVRLKLQAVVTRPPVDTSEAIRTVGMGLEKANKRLVFMEANRVKFDREDFREIQKVITLHEWKRDQLRDLHALEQRRIAAIAALDAQKALGKVTEDEYTSARKAIETSVV